MQIFRLFFIARVLWRFGLDDIVANGISNPLLSRSISRMRFGRDFTTPRAQRLREALESLGPIFVKFGQMLSTRRDLLPAEFADELAHLQDRVPPFDPELAIRQIRQSLGKNPDELFATFDRVPVASASIAQVHFATLRADANGVQREVAVKVLRPNMRKVIDGRHRAAAHASRASSRSCRPTASGCDPRTWSASSTSTCTTNST